VHHILSQHIFLEAEEHFHVILARVDFFQVNEEDVAFFFGHEGVYVE